MVVWAKEGSLAIRPAIVHKNRLFCEFRKKKALGFHKNPRSRPCGLSLMEVLFFFCSWWFAVQCFFGAAGCDSTVGMRGTIFIFMYVSAYAGSANLLRHSEGATWLAIVVVRRNDIRLRVVPLSFSPSSETQNKPARKKWPREILGVRSTCLLPLGSRAAFISLAGIIRVLLEGLSERGTTRSIKRYIRR